MPPSKLDALYRSLLLTKFFCKGWGKPENLQRLFEFRKIISNREACYRLVPRDYPVEITKEEVTSDSRILEGKFVTPLELYLPGLVPKVAQDAHFQIILPLKWKEEDYKPVCLHLAGTGDHYFWRRRNLIAKPLLKEANLGAILLENPFYGLRKPKDQKASSLHNVSDIFVMGGCLVLESLVLFHWCERNGLGPLGITGLSMGGHMASLAATNWPKPLVLVPCLSWSTASSVFTQGVMSQSINWDVLETQYFADGNYRERLSKMVTIIDDAFVAGQHFMQKFSESMQELKKDLKDVDDFIKTLPEENVNLTVVPQVPASIQPPHQKIVVLNGNSNKLNLSPSLLEKLLSTDKVELTVDEINELNTKIRIALNELKAENDGAEAAGDVKQLQSDTAASDRTTIITSVYEFGKTKLISLISPSSNANEAKIVATTDTAAVAKLDKAKIFDVNRTKWWEREASQFMRGIMDECTHLKNFSVPYDTSLIIAVCAKDDAYIPRDGCSSLEDIWPGAEIRYLDAGHVSAFVLHQKIFRSSIIEGFERAKKVYRENPQYRSQASVSGQTLSPVQA